MYSIDAHGNGNLVVQCNNDNFVEVCDNSPLSQVEVSDNNAFDLSVSNTIDILSPLSYKLLQDLCAGYGYSVDIETISETCEDNFLQKYAVEHGYRFTENFLSEMNNHKNNFVDSVDFILAYLCYSFSFLKEPKNNCKNITELMNKICCSFSKCVYCLRPKCVDNLRSDIIPIIIKSIFDSNAIDSSYALKMTYSEMERLFLHFVTTLEKLIMGRVMKYWRYFCNENNGLFVNHSNPFDCAYRFYRVAAPDIDCPAAFTNKFGECISFMAVAKIDEMVNDFVDRLDCELKKNIFSKCCFICNYGNDAISNLDKLREKFMDLVEEEFNKRIIVEGVKDSFSSFLKNVLIWNKDEGGGINKVLVIDKIIENMRYILTNKANNAYRVINSFKKRLTLFKRRSLVSVKYSRAVEDLWELKLHPEDSRRFLSIKRKFSNKSRKIVNNKFCEMLNEKYRFLDGTIVDVVDWDKISKNLFPVAQETVRHLVDDEHAELSKFLSNARVIENINVLDESSIGTRKISPEEIDRLLKVSVNSIHGRNRYLFSSVWRNLIKSQKSDKRSEMVNNIFFSNELGGTGKVVSSAVNPVLMSSVGDSDPPCIATSVQNELPEVVSISVDLLGKEDKIINRWGLNIHPDDDKLISFIRRKFSNHIIDHLTRLFSSMLKNRAVLPSGIVLCDYSWTIVSRELSEIAIESVESIVKKQYVELDRVLSKARIVDVGVNSDSSCTIRRVTNVEKAELVKCVKNLISKRLSVSIRTSWLCVVNKSSTDVGYGYKEKPNYILGSAREGSWGVKLRYSDNISILKTRRRFSSKIKCVLRDKFISMLEKSHKFDDGTFIGPFTWARISRKLTPIAKEEVSPILEDQKEELEKIVSRSRVVVDLVDREITQEEKHIVLRNIMNLAHNSLKASFRKIWDYVISSSRSNSIDIKDYLSTNNCDVDCNDVDILRAEGDEKNHISQLKLYYKDDVSILNVRKKFSSEIYRRISNKYNRMIEERYVFSDNTTIGMYPWRDISKKLLPIVKKEINPIVEKEREKINEILLKSRVDISSPNRSSKAIITRELTSEERGYILEKVMKSVYRKITDSVSQIWNKIIKSSSVGLMCLKEMERSELDNIKLEFFGILGSIVNEVVDFLLSDTNTSSLSSFDDITANIYHIVSERSHSLFCECGFLSRVESLLSDAKIVDASGKYRFVTDEEKKLLLKEFMAIIGTDRDFLIRKRISKLDSLSFPAELDLKVNSESPNKHESNVYSDGIYLLIENEHRYAKMASFKNVTNG
ncbi:MULTISPECIES: hypothetical protein [Candidatus Ichthyocystis]|uniref:Uncharacterized protein n=1 Tax=Candidatus Ichthyocystis hellenicum TaxID=1561003 RepID=A0A0S4M322_9BURK|nr:MULTISPECIES: hypothetical protein [Ichthyocystis]CUT17675.1 hypothetical protein Ark11_0852 [Candidatus Ichthyocystis hellenicum]